MNKKTVMFNNCMALIFSCSLILVSHSSIAQDSITITKYKDNLKELPKRIKDSKKGIVNSLEGKADNLLKSQLEKAKSAIDPVASKINLLRNPKPFSIDKLNLDLSYNYFRDTSEGVSKVYNNINSMYGYQLDMQLSLFSLPFNIALNGNNAGYTTGHTPLADLYHVNLDPAKYKERLQAEVYDKIRPEMISSSITNKIKAIRETYERKLKSEIDAVKDKYTNEFKEKISLPENIGDLSTIDTALLKTRFLSIANPENYESAVRRLHELKGEGAVKDSLSYNETVRVIKKYEVLNSIYSKVASAKGQFSENKVVKELTSHLPFSPDNYREFLKDPKNLKSVISEFGKLNVLQSMLSKFTKLDIGQNPLEGGELGYKQLMNKGVNAAMELKNTNVGFLTGSGSNDNPILQNGLSSMVTNEYSNLTGFTIGSPVGTLLNQGISISLYNFKNEPGLSASADFLKSSYLAGASRRDAVITWNSEIPIMANHLIRLEVSKSFGSYSNIINEDMVASKANAFNSLFGNEGKGGYAVLIDYEGEVFKVPIDITLKKAGLGYNNPGNQFIRRGESSLDIGLSRSFIDQKLNIQYRVGYTNQNFDPQSDYRHNALNNKIRLKWKYKKNNNIGFTYQRSDYTYKTPVQLSTKGLNSRLQLDGSYGYKIMHKKITNYFTMSNNSMSLPAGYGMLFKNKSLLFTHTSSVMLQKNLLTVSLTGNRSDTKDYYFSTSFFNAESSFTYTWNSIRLSSGLGYYINSGWNKQLGIRQQFTWELFSKLSGDFEINYKKAVQVIQPDLANQLFINTSFRFTL